MSLADQIKTWYELESYGAFKQVDARSAADKRALSVLKNDTFHDGERYIVPMLWNDKESTLPKNYFSSLARMEPPATKSEEKVDLLHGLQTVIKVFGKKAR